MFGNHSLFRYDRPNVEKFLPRSAPYNSNAVDVKNIAWSEVVLKSRSETSVEKSYTFAFKFSMRLPASAALHNLWQHALFDINNIRII